jgi:4-hydroxymandelate oxidase
MDPGELERRARERLDPAAYDFYAGGADDERTLAENPAAWRRWRLKPRVLRDVSQVDTSVSVCGTSVPTPVWAAPVAAHRMAHDDGELATVRGAAAAGSLMVASTVATVGLEDVAAAAGDAPCWFQLYVRRDRAHADELIARAAAAGYTAVVLTVDLPVLGRRRRDEVHETTPMEALSLPNLHRPGERGAWLAALASQELDPTLDFDDLAELAAQAEQAGLPLLVKGVLRGDDAAACVDAGAAGIVVSNHGGRQLDDAVTGAEALGDVVESVGSRVPVLVDGGLRAGSDVVKALALGASAVLVGRPVIWALSTGGSDGVAALLGELAADTARAMALCGARSIEELDPSVVVRARA